MFNKIVNLLVTVLPEKWEKVVLFSHVTNDMYEFFFYVQIKGNYINCFKLKDDYGISRKSILSCFDQMYDIMLPDYMEKNWYTATMMISPDGKFSLDYTYDDYSENEEQFKSEWKNKYLH